MNSFKIVPFLLLMAFMAIFFLLPPSVYSQPIQRHGGQHIGPPQVMQNLSSEQKEELLSLITEMRESGASREEISEAVHARLAEWGIDLPEGKPGRHGMLPWGVLQQLDEDQQAELKALIEEMRESGADREEIGKAVKALFSEWGIDLPEWEPGRHGFLPWGVLQQLDEDQKAELGSLVGEMREAGKSHKEIRHAIHRKIKEWQLVWPDVEEENQAAGRGSADLRLQNYPNPFNPETNITYNLDQAEQVSLAIFNAQGQLVRTLVNKVQAPGQYAICWDGLDQDGERVSSGLYFYRLQAGENIENDTMIMLK
jgi:DNA-binding transcriptional regulator YhcF (GntR family)